ncbi:MAG: phosphodiester glycosidase family protein [Deltaproteobacteria bacterium]|nr:MAG: phosphodiester glycosidase family protein [Deltaproteobacteria bacterium]
MFLRKGQLTQVARKSRGSGARHPRTAVALDASGRFLFLVLVDGRQPSYSEGVTLFRLGQILRDQYSVVTALNLDGGGSTTLVQEGPNGEARVLNCPIHGRIPPGRERPVANHLGIFARKLVPSKK